MRRNGRLLTWASLIVLSLVIIARIFLIEDIAVEDQRIKVTPKNSRFRRIDDPRLKKVIKAYEKEFKKLMDETGTPGAAVAIVQDSVVVYQKGFGVKSIDARAKVNENTVFRIASVSKCFAAVLTGILVQEGTLQWTDPIVKHIPDFSLSSPDQTRRLTIANVLSHTTGLPYHTYTNMVEEGRNLDELLLKLKDIKLASDVGSMYSYQNVAYSLIAKVMERATGKSYETLMKEKVLIPLGMTHASLDYATLLSNENLARPHHRTKKGWAPSKITNTYYNVAPAGGINASISDMAQWMKALLGQRQDVINDETLAILYTPQIEARSKNRNYGKMQKLSKSYYGLGWRILHYPSDTLVYHGGYVNGYRSEVALEPKDKIAICILANGPGALADNGIPIFFNLYNQEMTKTEMTNFK